MTLCEVPFAKVPIGVTCAISPIDLIAAALTDNVTDSNICELEVGDGVGVDVEGADGAGDWLHKQRRRCSNGFDSRRYGSRTPCVSDLSWESCVQRRFQWRAE